MAHDLNSKLCMACGDGLIFMIKELIKEGANDFERGLDAACYGRRPETIIMMAKKINTNILNRKLLFWCDMAPYPYEQEEIAIVIQSLIDGGANNLQEALEFTHDNSLIELGKIIHKKGIAQKYKFNYKNVYVEDL